MNAALVIKSKTTLIINIHKDNKTERDWPKTMMTYKEYKNIIFA
jgi:hypothetical protein